MTYLQIENYIFIELVDQVDLEEKVWLLILLKMKILEY